ncbi:FG-GAP-like repeat-containing protein [Streptomyces sp. NPDC012888]|uniref:FG-GAP-like repeat-containing protein n=1 Tax=Streptomyces sp. NPDC012888 TaxID=3364855 RepID=UPI0036A54234
MAAALSTLAVPLMATTAVAAPAATAQQPELVLPPMGEAARGTATIRAVTSTGVLRGEGVPTGYTLFGEDVSRPFDAKGSSRVFDTGTDTIALLDGSVMRLRQGFTGAEESLAIPAGLKPVAVTGRTVVALEHLADGAEPGDPEKKAVHLLTLENGAVKDRRLTELQLPTFEIHTTMLGSNGHGALFRYQADDGQRQMWIDTAGEGRAVPLAYKFKYTQAREGVEHEARVMGDFLIRPNAAGTRTEVYDTRADLHAPSRDFPGGGSVTGVIGVAGAELLVPRATQDGFAGLDALDTTGAKRKVLDDGLRFGDLYVDPLPVAPGNRPLAVVPRGLTGSWDIHELKADAQGKAQAVRVGGIPSTGSATVAALAAESDRVHSVQRFPSGEFRRYRHTLDHGDPAKEAAPVQGEDQRSVPSGEMVAAGDGKLLYATGPENHLAGTSVQVVPGTLQASGRYAAFRAAATPGQPVQVWNVRAWTPGRSFPAPGGAFALSGTALWRNTATAGTVEALDVRTGGKLLTLKVADCAITEMQALTSSLYWKCDGSRSGVHDVSTKTTVKLPAHNGTARLGQGFVAFTDGPVLKVADVKGGTGVREIAEPRTTEVGKGWTVDRYGSRIVHVDAAHATHVLSAGTPAPGLVAYDTDAPTTADLTPQPGKAPAWSPTWWLSKPAASSTLTLVSKATGATVRTYTGGAARGTLTHTWNGKDSAGRNAPNGVYTWTLKVKPADGKGPELTRTGTVTIGGRAVYRDYTGNTVGDLFAKDAKGLLALHTGSGRMEHLSSATWPATSTFAPIGDMDDDRANDVLVRDAAGVLRAYLATPGKAVTPSTPSRVIGPGWGQYDVLTSAGDMNRDGRADLIARQASTGDIYFYAQDGLGGFKPRVKIMSNWKVYKEVFGAGDLNRDGIGDLLAIDGTGALWRYTGTGTGTVTARVKLGAAGWAKDRVNTVGMGDYTNDGHADLVGLTTQGTLLRNRGSYQGTDKLGPTTPMDFDFRKYTGLL